MTTTDFEKYDTYKDSGIAQIEEIPNHWETRRLKDVSFIQYSNVDKKTYEDELPVKLCNYVDVYKNDFINSSLLFMQATANQSEIKRFSVKKHDVLVTKDSETADDIANPALVVEDLSGVLCGYHLAQIRTIKNTLYAPFLFRLFQANNYGFRFVIYAKGITRVGLSTSAFSDALTPLPPLAEQKAIADYLNEKSDQIDRKIDLLTQKAAQYAQLKQALINETVTRGLNKNAPLKDSGIDWLGEIPAHWEVNKIKRISNVKRGASPRPIDDPKYFDDAFGKYGWVRIKDVTKSSKYLLTTEEKLSELGSSKSVKMKPGDIFLSIAGSVGKPIITKINCCIHDGFVYFVNFQEYKEFLFYIFNCTNIFAGLGKIGTQLNLNTEIVGNIDIPIPPLSEQKAIAEYLDTKTAHIDRIIETIHSQIETLHELRKTLINDVVTGKIKVVG